MQISDARKAAKYSTLDIGKALGIERERMRDWISRGYIEPTVPAFGQGTKAGFTRIDVYGVAVFRDLVEKGLKRELATQLAKDYVLSDTGVHGHIQVILFSYLKGHEEPVVHYVVPGKPWSVEVTVSEVKVAGMKVVKEGWKDIYMINLVEMKAEIDKALGEGE